MGNHIQSFNIEELFSSDKYQIPIYQRNYAWRKPEISQLIDDINDYVSTGNNYYIGTLIVYERFEGHTLYYETIDGQQRLTTLSILLSVLKNEFGISIPSNETILSFESRKLSQTAIEFAYRGYFDGTENYHSTIREAYDHILNELKTKIDDVNTFASYLLKKVTVLRVEVPKDTDLNHYFEIMNNRGEQLEKHEVLKSYLLEVLETGVDETDRLLQQELLNIIWEACSNMDRYVQFGFEPELRKLLFGKKWTFLECSNFQELFDLYKSFYLKKKANIESNTSQKNINQILSANNYNVNEISDDETSNRFHAVINFQNFLLHILKIQTQNADYVLDDKRLLVFFADELKRHKGKREKKFVQDLIFNILKGKHLLDTYIVKRQYLASGDSWSLLKLVTKDGQKGYYVNSFEKNNDRDNKTVVMLLSMFHVSTPTMIYKYWLNDVLKFLMEAENVNCVDCNSYIEHLETFAKDLICLRFLNENKAERLNYNTLIYNYESLPEDYPHISEDNKLLTYGLIENNLLFNFLDYIIWNNDDKGIHNNFEFTFRSSVEHYYPQHPIGGKPLENKKALNSFGNLCLISHQKNSKLNHHLPTAKKDYYAKLDSGGQLAYDSLKQYVMMNEYDPASWGEDDIFDHNKKMIMLLNDFIQNN